MKKSKHFPSFYQQKGFIYSSQKWGKKIKFEIFSLENFLLDIICSEPPQHKSTKEKKIESFSLELFFFFYFPPKMKNCTHEIFSIITQKVSSHFHVLLTSFY
jgi:hypothetical protein